jgi:hypothetical protein
MHLQGFRAWVRSAAAIAVLLPRVGVDARGVLLFVFVAANVAFFTGAALLSFRWARFSSFIFLV